MSTRLGLTKLLIIQCMGELIKAMGNKKVARGWGHIDRVLHWSASLYSCAYVHLLVPASQIN